jgi:IS30 family transposase
MGRSYGQLSLEDRCTIAQLQKAGQSIRQIASALDRAPSTIARELKRNRGSSSDTNPRMLSSEAGSGAGWALA